MTQSSGITGTSRRSLPIALLRSAASSRTVSSLLNESTQILIVLIIQLYESHLKFQMRKIHMIGKHLMKCARHCYILDSLMMTDKKNENKKVDVEDFLPAEAAIDAIKYSMWVCWVLFINSTQNPASSKLENLKRNTVLTGWITFLS